MLAEDTDSLCIAVNKSENKDSLMFDILAEIDTEIMNV
jgi:hypothetical protein